jgi:hypothetical protein
VNLLSGWLGDSQPRSSVLGRQSQPRARPDPSPTDESTLSESEVACADQVLAAIALGRCREARESADVAVFVSSVKAAYITGANVLVGTYASKAVDDQWRRPP